MAAKKKTGEMATMLLDDAIPWPHRQHMLLTMAMDDEGQIAIQQLLAAAKNSKVDEIAMEKLKSMEALLAALDEGPQRPATFLGWLGSRKRPRRAHVKTADGSSAFVVVADDKLAASLRCGQEVLVDARGRAIVDADTLDNPVGEVARLVRRVGPGVVEVTFPHGEEKHVFHASASLAEKLDRQEVAAGASLRVCRRRGIAFDALPVEDGLSDYRFLCREPVPDVVLERDLGAPPKFLLELIEQIRHRMTHPDVHSLYKLRPSLTKLLQGPSGTGKSYAIQALWHELYELMAEMTGVAANELPPRVMKLKMADVLSKYLGESDQRLSRFFDEVEQLAGEKFKTPDGQEIELPVLVIFEECESLGRERGAGQDAIYDRIQTTLLQRLDATTQKLRDQLVIAIFTTNVPWLLDSATARRFGGTVEQFGRLGRMAFCDVLKRHVRDLPIQCNNGHPQAELEQDVVDRVTTWLYCRNGDDRGVVELSYVGQPNPAPRRMCDFMTPALVDRAVQQAAARACRAQINGEQRPGLSAALLAECIEQQVRGIVDRVRPDNVAEYLDLPEGIRVASVRRVNGSASLALQLRRSA